VIFLHHPYAEARCESCGVVVEFGPELDTVDPNEQVCSSCYAESEAAAQEELAREFRWMSRDWLRCVDCKGTGIRKDEHCYCRKGRALHEAEAARFAFVRQLPALAVTSARHMTESGINPQQRIAK
jgi:hypothetical protein